MKGIPTRTTGLLSLALLQASFLLPASKPASAQQTDCPGQVYLQHSFSSGASWSMCATVNADHGLHLTAIHYYAPGDSIRSVLQELHLSQILLHYHDQPTAEAQITPATNTAESESVTLTEQSCDGEALVVTGDAATVCSRIKDNRIMAKYSQRPGLHSQSWELSSSFSREALIWTSSVTFTEDGLIKPAIGLSGRASRYNDNADYAQYLPQDHRPLTRATILSTWRMAFDLDTTTTDRVEEFNFTLDTENGNRRPMTVSPIETETLRQVDREQFRGWRVVDASGSGYYLDPSNSGYNYSGNTWNWTNFDVAVTRHKFCEQHALLNLATAEEPTCKSTLDDFVNNEPLENSHPVLWYSLTRTFAPSLEDLPVISNHLTGFDLLPFDWTDSSPFEMLE